MTSTSEIFVSPPLVQVAFEIRFPTLFYINQRIGEFQLEIMDDFPKSSQIFEQSFAFGNKEDMIVRDDENPVPSWQFENESGKTKITIHSNKLNIISTEYKSYNHPSDNNFRDVINNTVSLFIKTVQLKKFSRIGLRYIDQCPLEILETDYFINYYKPTFDIEKYEIENIIDNQMQFRIRKENHNLLFQCGIRQIDEKYNYFMDFDGYTLDIEASNFMNITDELHRLTKAEFLSNITENFIKYMRDSHE